MNRYLAIGLLAVAQAFISTGASAATCTLKGRVQIQAMDPFYCDTDVLGAGACTGWAEVDLDRIDRPMQHMLMSAHTSTGETLGLAKTDSSGQYTITFTRDSCNLDVLLVEWFSRIHEADGAVWPPRYRFIVTGTSSNVSWSASYVVPVRSATTTFNVLHRRSTGQPDDSAKYANVYYILNSIISEAVRWDSVIDQYFKAQTEAFWVRYNPYYDYGDAVTWFPASRELLISSAWYNHGSRIRHEMGHLLHAVIHGATAAGMNQWHTCYRIYTFGNDNSQTHGAGCEWAADATFEALATFIGLRTLLPGVPSNAWMCDCLDNARPDICSNAVAAMARQSDRVGTCSNGSPIAGLGDDYVSFNTSCIRLKAADGCRKCTGLNCVDCVDTSPRDGFCDDNIAWGFRNETNIVRYLWDLIDAGTDGGFDDTDRSMAEVVAALRSMPCVSGSGFGVDGTCNEPARADSSQCNPTSTIGDVPANVTGTRDSYNARDLHVLLNTGASNELGLNCVSGAKD